MVRDGLSVWDDPRNSQGMLEWITDRLPTADDTYQDGHVQITFGSNDHPNPFHKPIGQSYRAVGSGQKWWSPKAQAKIDAIAAQAKIDAMDAKSKESRPYISMDNSWLVSELAALSNELNHRITKGLI